MNPWNVSERKAALLLKLQELRLQGRLQPAALERIEQLYAEGRDFAAERLAGYRYALATFAYTTTRSRSEYAVPSPRTNDPAAKATAASG